MIFMEKNVVRSTIYNGACLPGLSLFKVSHTRLWWPLFLSPLVTDPAASRPPGERECGALSLSHRWSLIRLHPVRRGKGRKCIVSPFDGAEAACPNLRYMSFSLTKLQRGRAYATCSQIPPAATHLVTPRQPPGIPSSLAPDRKSVV